MTEAHAAAFRSEIAPLMQRLHAPLPVAELHAVVDSALTQCRALYQTGRSADALPLAREVLAHCMEANDAQLIRRAATVCGHLATDSGDLVGGIEHHVQVLRLATAAADPVEMGRVWNNIGVVTLVSGNYDMAARCFQRALALVETHEEHLQGRFAACANLADCCYQAGNLDQGIGYGERALLELTDDFVEQDPHGAVLVRRNLVRLLVASGRVPDAEAHVREAAALAGKMGSSRAVIAAATTRATYEIAVGEIDIALTRIDRALCTAREVPGALHDTLACAIRAEEAAGNAARALIRLEELSNHVYRTGVERARQFVELAALADAAGSTRELKQEQVRARLTLQLARPAQPESWQAMQRLAASAVMRIDQTGWHGMRVGALTKALALFAGTDPLQALEIGLAAELHDIGMMSVPAGILTQRAPLNDAEKAIVKRHPEAGAEMLSDNRHPRVFLAREIARFHHAHWDGKGYPERVGGTFIPLGARMCAIADAYDMMVCGYGATKPRAMGEALDVLRQEAGRQFDPALVATFEDMIRSESQGCGVDLGSSPGMEDFQELVQSLQEDRGFV
ncbi:MAG TPA: HD domain-containing phosphohydrolase [Usitatibacter sp.]|nr:HD domain-containing phosphohydrolase [Usitatibacter sp.]